MSKLFLLVLFLWVSPVHAEGVAAGAARPDTPVLIVDRRADAVTLFLSLPATDLQTVFGTGAGDLLDAEDTIDVARLYDGTFELADRIFAPVETLIGGVPVPFEATSMMVHDPEVLPDFLSPWDGEVAIAVCTSPETVDNLGLQTLQAYMGFFAWKVNGMEPVSLEFPMTGRSPQTIEVREFWNLQFIGARTEILQDGGTLTLETGRGTGLGTATLGLFALAFLGVGVVLLLAFHHERRGVTTDVS